MSYEGSFTQPGSKPALKTFSSKKASDLIEADCLELLQKRNHEEEKSARLYEDMYMFLNNKGFTGAGKLWHKYAHEELTHADWAREYMMSLGVQPELRPMPKLTGDYTGLVDVIEKSYEHEILITEQCKELAACAIKCGDFMLYELAAKYLKEQIEELDKVQTWMDKLEIFGKDKNALRFLDNEMGEID
jgi:ferritin